MKIGIVAGYCTTSFISMVTLYITVIVTIFAGLFAGVVLDKLPVTTFYAIMLPLETALIVALLNQKQKFDRRTRFLDTLIVKIEKDPAENVGTMKEILDAVRTLSGEASLSRWTLRKKILHYYAKITLGLIIVGGVALVFQFIIQTVAANMNAGNWVGVGWLFIYTLFAVFVVILLLYVVDKYYDRIISRMVGQKGPPKE